ncbi:serine--tRNA synthetase-like protein Slimp [Culex quinquefasciatus]|uniref:serine--tRNA synthetase-like protein Slimp n=1 Tax=Culex quinquefasciatus TaxID=7176 RepID=UPI0018E2DBD1|nr:serine--tRNA synthetase-like protein Slimp [Culex quinquefasciatus]
MLKLRQVFLKHMLRRTFSSALYITGDKAKEQYAPLVPYLDFKSKLADLEDLRRNLRARRYQLDFEALVNQWNLYRSVELRKRDIESRRLELRNQIGKLKEGDEVQQLKVEAAMARDDLKHLKESGYAIADAFVAGQFLGIPNELHELTPEGESGEVLFERTVQRDDVETVGEDFVEEYDSTCYYMTQDAALMDLFLPMNCAELFQDAGYVLFSNPDFVRTVLVEAAREDPNSIYLVNEEVEIENKLNLLHLCGGGSMLSFLGYLTKLSVFPTALPLRLVAPGKQYFYEKIQTSAVQTMTATREAPEAIEIFDETIELYKRFYGQFQMSYRLVRVPAYLLAPAESMRVDVQVYSPKEQDFVKVADVAYYSDFISKRIAFNYHEGKTQKFPHMVSGCALRAIDLIKILLQHGVRFKDLGFLNL